jgi:diguanylate cyclase (GGDEF)-like protein
MKAVLTNTTLTTEAFLRHKDGYRVPVLIKTVPIRDVNGKPVGAVELFSDSSFRISIEERLKTLEKQALTDPLTGLSNRRHADAVLAAKFEELRRFGWKFGVVFVDIDGLKKINDELGHESGDHAIRLVARNLISNSRAFDVSARWGGEEFVIICENIQLGELREIAERMRSLIENSVLRVGERTLKITISIGATIVNESDSTETVVARADALMYESKMAGKNRASVRE